MSILEIMKVKVLNLLAIKMEEFAWKSNTHRGKVGLKYDKHQKPPALFKISPRKVVSIKKKKKKTCKDGMRYV